MFLGPSVEAIYSYRVVLASQLTGKKHARALANRLCEIGVTEASGYNVAVECVKLTP